jgi:hypothetical protein
MKERAANVEDGAVRHFFVTCTLWLSVNGEGLGILFPMRIGVMRLEEAKGIAACLSTSSGYQLSIEFAPYPCRRHTHRERHTILVSSVI